jgi:hypothetical protein
VQQLRALTTAIHGYGSQVPVEEWRARLWQDALEASGVQDSSLGAQLQAHFTQQRSTGFVFDDRAVVRLAMLTLTACFQESYACSLRTAGCACAAAATRPACACGVTRAAAGYRR